MSPNRAGFMNVLRTVMNLTAAEAALMKKKFATNAPTVEFQTLYVLVQCTLDLLSPDCRRCLRGLIADFTWCCDGKIGLGGRVLYPSCLALYELYQFFSSSQPVRPITLPPPPPLLSPPTDVGSESNTLEPLQFSLATIEAATNKSSQETSSGQGGFGQVFKGILSNGQERAVKMSHPN